MIHRLLFFLIAGPAAAHTLSLSTGDLRVDAQPPRLHYELRLSLHDAAEIENPEQSIFDHVRFFAAGGEARLVSKRCRAENAEDRYVCEAGYELPAAPSTITVECTLYSITAPNHVHLLRATAGDKTQRVSFDFSFQRAELRFQPPGRLEAARREMAAGALQAAGELTPLVLLLALAAATNRRRDLAALLGVLLAAQGLGAAIPWRGESRFLDALGVLSVAYLAAEGLLRPGRVLWFATGAAGLIHGLGLAQFAGAAGFGSVWVLAGAGLAETIWLVLVAVILDRIMRVDWAQKLNKIVLSIVLAACVIWFGLRLLP